MYITRIVLEIILNNIPITSDALREQIGQNFQYMTKDILEWKIIRNGSIITLSSYVQESIFLFGSDQVDMNKRKLMYALNSNDFNNIIKYADDKMSNQGYRVLNFEEYAGRYLYDT